MKNKKIKQLAEELVHNSVNGHANQDKFDKLVRIQYRALIKAMNECEFILVKVEL